MTKTPWYLRDWQGKARVPGDWMLHRVPLCAVAVLVLNDHAFKRWWPSAVTGKISDFAGMLFFPLLLMALSELVLALLRLRSWQIKRGGLMIATLATGLGFGAINVLDVASNCYRDVVVWAYSLSPFASRVMGPQLVHTKDVTDLIALPLLILTWRLGKERLRRWNAGRS